MFEKIRGEGRTAALSRLQASWLTGRHPASTAAGNPRICISRNSFFFTNIHPYYLLIYIDLRQIELIYRIYFGKI